MWQGPMDVTLPFSDYRLNGGHTDIICSNQIYLNSLHSEVVGILKHHPCALTPARASASYLVKVSLPNMIGGGGGGTFEAMGL